MTHTRDLELDPLASVWKQIRARVRSDVLTAPSAPDFEPSAYRAELAMAAGKARVRRPVALSSHRFRESVGLRLGEWLKFKSS